MASSLMAMGRAVGREIQVSHCNRLTFEAEGNVVVFQAIGGDFPCILCLVLRPGAVLGRALWSAGEISQTLAGQR
jgi:predicted regulator of Ras-like GTPase activity (Roadblock/LC7/MglB family)